MLKIKYMFIALLSCCFLASCTKEEENREFSESKQSIICGDSVKKQDVKSKDTQAVFIGKDRFEQVDPEKVQMMKAANNQDHIVVIRNAFNEFLNHPHPPEFYKESASGSDSTGKTGLAFLEKNGFLKSKFVPINVDDAPNNSYKVEIIFVDKQDMIFEVLVAYEKRNFIVKQVKECTKYDERDLRSIKILYSNYLNDKSYGI